MTSCELEAAVAARCGDLQVPENPAAPGGRRIGIRVAVIGARSTPASPDPVFFVTGGPGSSTIDDFAQAATLFPGLTQRHDVVLVDQRGTGASHRLVLPEQLPGQDPTAYVRAALSMIDADPRYYTTAVAMDDLDAVRQALGYRSIDLYGASYGATAVQYYLRQHGDHVRTAVLDSGSLLEVPIFEQIAPNSQRALDDVFRRCAADPACAAAYPDPAGELTTVLDRLAHSPVTAGGVSSPTVVVQPELLADLVHTMLLRAEDAANIPMLIHRTAAGDFEPVAQIWSRIRAAAPPALLMSNEINCSESWARFEPERVRVLGAGSYYGAAQLSAALARAAWCSLIPRGFLPAGDDQPARTTVPMLLMNRQDDPQDPPANSQRRYCTCRTHCRWSFPARVTALAPCRACRQLW